ncbi:MAG: hypothetical protein CMP11_06980 [Zetaproteobacteria bacterium]|nr:hypothetical protein [Pseudobdellovibrionaceae bacterium]|tara:strand:+ start:562 stop:1341 length:780 start_codon:yes stop_codon:yes gene_type:complete
MKKVKLICIVGSLTFFLYKCTSATDEETELVTSSSIKEETTGEADTTVEEDTTEQVTTTSDNISSSSNTDNNDNNQSTIQPESTQGSTSSSNERVQSDLPGENITGDGERVESTSSVVKNIETVVDTEYSLSFNKDNPSSTQGVLELTLTSDVELAGIQLSLTGVTLEEGSYNLENKSSFTVQVGPSVGGKQVVLGYSMSGTTLDSGKNIVSLPISENSKNKKGTACVVPGSEIFAYNSEGSVLQSQVTSLKKCSDLAL